jgi:hypothetical protein
LSKLRGKFPWTIRKKSFWLLFTLLGLGAFFLPLWWAVAETVAALIVSWWVIYRSGIY